MAQIVTVPDDAVKYPIDLDINGKIMTTDTPKPKQYDTRTSYIIATVWNDGISYPLTTDDLISFNCTKPDNFGINNEANIDIDGRIVYQITEQTTAKDGGFLAEFRIYGTTIDSEGNVVAKRKGTPSFKIYVEKSALNDSTVISTDEFNILTQTLAEVQGLETAVQNALTNVNVAITNAETATQNAIDAITASNTATANAIQATTDAQQATTEAETATQNAVDATTASETQTSLAETATQNAIDATNNAVTATTNANNATTSANDAADNANTIATELENETLKIYKNSVTAYSDLATTYPTPENGWTVTVINDNVSYRWNGTEWINLGYIAVVDIATESTVGTVKGGGNVSIAVDGVLSVPDVGDLSNLTTTSNTDLVSAVNENKESIDILGSDLGNKSLLTTNIKSSAIEAINEINNNINYELYDFNINKTPETFHTRLDLPIGKIMQSYFYNKDATYMFSIIADGLSPESYTLYRMSNVGIIIDYMTLTNCGHGSTVGIENIGEDVYIWSSVYDSVNSIYKLVRYLYVPFANYTIGDSELVEYNQFGEEETYFSIYDEMYCFFARKVSGIWQVEKRILDDVKNGVNTILNTVNIPDIDTCKLFQGFAADENILYWLSGLSNDPLYPQKLSSFDISSNYLIEQNSLNFGNGSDGILENNYKEPEGLFLYKDSVTGAKSLFLGLATGSWTDRPNKAYAFHSFLNLRKFDGFKSNELDIYKTNNNRLDGGGYLINGDFQIWQRGTSFTGGSGYTADRWYKGGTGEVTKNGNELNFKSTSTGYSNLDQYFENPSTYAGKLVTISIKATLTLENIAQIKLYRNRGGSETAWGNTNIINNEITKFSFIITEDLLDTDKFGVRIQFIGAETVNEEITVDWIKVEVGSIATKFNSKPYWEELISCQRYYYKRTADSSYGQIAIGDINSTTSVRAFMEFPVEMRAVPSLSYSSGNLRWSYAGTNAVIGTLSATSTTKKSIGITQTGLSGLTTGFVSILQANNDSSAYVSVDAEIY